MKRWPPLLVLGMTLFAGFAGGYVFDRLHLPAPWISGSMVMVVGLIAMGVKPTMPAPLRDFGMLLTGVALGSAITPEMLAALERYPFSLTLLVLTTCGIVLVGRWVLMRFFAFSSAEALFASLPGALSAVLASAADAKVDLVRVASLQAFRLFVLVALLPSMVSGGVAPARQALQPIIGAEAFALEMGLGLIVALIFARIHLMAPFLMGGMVIAGMGHASRSVVGVPPDLVVNLGMLLIGVFAGTRFANVDGKSFRALIVPAFVLFAATMVVSAIGAVLVIIFTGTPMAEAFVAFAPGGLEAMVALGVAMGLDPLYLSSHHIARFVLIAFAVPFIGKFVMKNPPP